MTALIIQARLDSGRLPGKCMLPLGERPMVFRVMQALSLFPVKILACPEDSVYAFSPLAEEAGFTLLSGPKDDVLARYCIAINKSGADRVVRATSDNPFVFIDAALAIASEAEELNADYSAYSAMPYGSGVEAVSSIALLRAGKEASASYDREHVCPYLYNNPQLFYLHRPLAPLKWRDPKIRITVDTEDDYKRANHLFSYMESIPSPEKNYGERVISSFKELFPGDINE